MGETLMAIFFCLAILAIATVAFWVWFVALLVRSVLRIGRAIFGALFFESPAATAAPESFNCPRPRCRAANAPGARFCHRCGQELLRAQRVQVHRRAALW